MLMNEQMRKMEITEMLFLRAASGYRMTDQKCNEVIREELEITNTNTIIKELLNRNGYMNEYSYQLGQIKCHSVVISIPASYSEGLGFEPQLLTDVSHGFLSPSMQML
jgi:hypothetical protein